jgi:hypothetical protein
MLRKSRRLGRPRSRSGRYREAKILDPTGEWNSDVSVIQPIAYRRENEDIPFPMFLLLSTKTNVIKEEQNQRTQARQLKKEVTVMVEVVP